MTNSPEQSHNGTAATDTTAPASQGDASQVDSAATSNDAFDWSLKFFGALLGIAAASVILRVPFLSVPMITDEGGYAYVARFWSSEYQLYRDIPFYRPQAIFFLYQGIFATLGDDVFAIRLFAALYNGLTVVALGLLGRQMFSAKVGLLAAGVFALFSVGPSMEGFTANAEIFAQLPIVISALFAWRKQWAFAGLAAACAVLLKPSGLSALLLALGWVFVTGASFRGAFKVSLTFGLGLLPSVLHGAWIGWEHYWDSMVTQRAKYATDENRALGAQWDFMVAGVRNTIASWGVPTALSLAGLTGVFGRAQFFGILWLGCSLFGMAMGGFWFEHYFIQLLPPVALLAGAGLAVWPRNRSGWLLTVPVLLALWAFRSDVRLWTAEPDEISLELYQKPAYLVANEIANYVAETTDEDDTVFVAFAEAEIYYLAGRRASFPHMYFADFEYSQELFDGAVASIRNREPAMVILVQSPPVNRMNREEFLALLSEGYEEVQVVESELANTVVAYLFRRK